MNAEHETVSALLGVWVLGACSAEESAAVIDHLTRCRVCADESLLLGAADDLLSGRGGPPVGLRARMLDRALTRRPPAPAVPGYAAPYAAQVSVLDSLLGELAGPDWARTAVAEYGWSVQDLVAHLAATDGLLAARLGADSAPGDGDDVPARTAAMLARHRGLPPERTRAAWRDQATALCSRLGADARDQLVELEWPLPVGATILSRAFETWIHTADIAVAAGRTLPAPLPEHLHPMADLGVTMLPTALSLAELDRPDGMARVVLTGPGGGDWLVPLGADSGSELMTAIELDVLEFCFLLGGRRDPGEVGALVDGDERLARDLLAAAPALSGP
ncbi:hypothetical protein DPM19_19835 [Actinomadura craniellae]|uniref:Mycothiol-dependent maleylpyruvate isomerase metal-binding domain-containing protein n=1 Tax=Actinomadura craniellae TaxID=2231787 RepID=A0A365H2K9_9ACTN|nr:maleylpyruvate isomerase family mycothiol-dependent enzyme [Actinomadura craniellae]RAY13331.1 hypothetical protein DPM19_19835 [Actinomadura craniellae]